MGNHQNSNRLREKVKIVLKKKISNQFNQLPIQVISLISSFLTIKDYNHVLLVSSTTYHIFGQVSSSYQIHCQNILKIHSEIIQSKNWKTIVYQLHCIPIKGLPYERSLKSICHNIKQHPIYVENEKNYSTFQKCILYFEEQFNLLYTIEYQQVKKFASENFDILLKLRQGEEINIQLPQMLMNIYNIEDFIRIFNLYLEIRFEDCDLEQFLQLWDRYCGWISIIEWSTLQLISQFNQIIEEILNKFKLPKFTFRHFMTTLWIKQYDKIKYRFQSEFQKKLITSRLKNQNIFILRKYIQYLIDVSTNQFNVHQYGNHNFPFNHEIINLTELTTEIIKKINKDYQTDKQILIYIFGEQIFQQILFPNLTQFWIDQFKIEITKHSQNYYIVNETSENENQILIKYNKRQQIRNLINSILVKEECSSEILESKQSNNSLSQISLVSTNYSSVYTTQNELLLSYIKQTQIEFYQQMEDFFQIQDQINEQVPDIKQCHYDIPELCAYHEISSEKMLELLYNKKQPINKVLQQQISAKTTAQEMLFQVLN